MTQAVFVLGASGGVGSALCRTLHARGVRLALAGRDASRLEPLARELGALAVPLADGSMASIGAAVASSVEELGGLDGAVCCAGSLLLKPAHRTTDEEYRATLAANLDAAFAVVRGATQAMLKRGGSIVLVSSAAARLGLANHEAIAAAKAGIEGLTRAAAASGAPRGIRVNAVAPGLTRTPLTEGLLSASASEQASLSMHALGRLGEPEDIARAIAWLLDPEQSWVTGQVLGVDGGLGSVRGR
jgi:NAD(P)-dependent dehydrogenase (short-subunit alcohol dehydrogenase family)